MVIKLVFAARCVVRENPACLALYYYNMIRATHELLYNGFKLHAKRGEKRIVSQRRYASQAGVQKLSDLCPAPIIHHRLYHTSYLTPRIIVFIKRLREESRLVNRHGVYMYQPAGLMITWCRLRANHFVPSDLARDSTYHSQTITH